MSRTLTSYGVPYFQMSQQDTLGMTADVLYGGGLSDLNAIIRVNHLPTVLASSSEMHPFLSFQYQSGPSAWTALLEIGITPQGAFCGASSTGAAVSGPDAALTPGSGWHKVRGWYDYTTGTLSLFLDDTYTYTATDAGGAPLVSPNGEAMRLVLFNGASLLSTSGLSVKYLLAVATDVMQGGAQHPLLWDFLGGSALDLPGDPDPADYTVPNFTLTGELATSQSTHPYPVPAADVGDSMRWSNETVWSQRVRPTTAWTKAGA